MAARKKPRRKMRQASLRLAELGFKLVLQDARTSSPSSASSPSSPSSTSAAIEQKIKRQLKLW